jgi:hypothetical protein
MRMRKACRRHISNTEVSPSFSLWQMNHQGAPVRAARLSQQHRKGASSSGIGDNPDSSRGLLGFFLNAAGAAQPPPTGDRRQPFAPQGLARSSITLRTTFVAPSPHRTPQFPPTDLGSAGADRVEVAFAFGPDCETAITPEQGPLTLVSLPASPCVARPHR